MTEENLYVRMIELKLSQGAKPGKESVLPASKTTDEIAAIRQVPMGKDVATGDNNHTHSLLLTYGYSKDPVPVVNMDALFSCLYLGGIHIEAPIPHDS